MSKGDSAREDPGYEKPPGRLTSLLRSAALLLFLGLASFVTYDGLLNHKHVMMRLLHWRQLQIRLRTGHDWTMKDGREFQVVGLKDSVLNDSAIAVIDQAYRAGGYARIYFRYADGQSDRLAQLYRNLAVIDTGETVRRSVEDITRRFHAVRRALRLEPNSYPDSLARHDSGSPQEEIGTNVIGTPEKDAVDQLKAVAKQNPAILVGIGVGIAASAGIDLLGGQTFVALSTTYDRRIDSIETGSKTGLWEGRPIDVLWCFASAIHDSLQVGAR